MLVDMVEKILYSVCMGIRKSESGGRSPGSGKRKVFFLIVGVIVLVGLGLEIWQMRGRLEEMSITKKAVTEELQEEIIEKTFENSAKIPIFKVVDSENRSVMYELRGKMVGEFRDEFEGFMVGDMVLEGDKSNQLLRFIGGSGGGNIYFGQMQWQDAGLSGQWQLKDRSEIDWLFVDGTPLVLRLRYDYEENTEYAAAQIKVLDGLIEQYENNESLEIPEGFAVSMFGIGIIEE